tara:strand:- start:291 stop:1259 length:969 start_codon:yes stop_codon:yes gene_type:complete
MLRIITAILVVIIISCSEKNQEVPIKQPIAIVVHGGAGTILKKNMSDEKEKRYKSKLEEAIRTGYQVLQNGGTSLDAVEQTIMILEDSPLFNAGKGAVFTHDKRNELDASIMDGSNLKAGAVAGVTQIKNPIRAARAVMEKSEHVLLAREGAEQFALLQKLDKVSPTYFFTEKRARSLERAIKEEKFGTVGCVALDRNGNIAAGTSTGGMTNKRWGRIGDSPIIGAGTYANNKTCGVSSTGWGEYFIRGVVAHDISAMMEYGGKSLKESANHVIHHKLTELGGTGGIIALDQKGNMAMEFNTEGMYRGYMTKDSLSILIYKE